MLIRKYRYCIVYGTETRSTFMTGHANLSRIRTDVALLFCTSMTELEQYKSKNRNVRWTATKETAGRGGETFSRLIQSCLALVVRFAHVGVRISAPGLC